MSKQDRQAVRDPTELERKYDLRAIAGLKKASKMNADEIVKTNKILEDFVVKTVGSLENMQSQLDGNITVHFYNGVPALDVLPASDWVTDEDKELHLGDWYYDRDTGRVYKFVFHDDLYQWEESESNSVIEAMALANAAKDAADGKRRVFTDIPYPPYDNGDIWFKDGEIYRCQISKAESETFEENDFIIATIYTDNTLAIQVGEELKVLSGTVATIKEGVDSFEIEFEKKIISINEQQQETVEQLEKTSYKFGTEDFTVSKEGEEISTHISHNGMEVQKDGQDVLVANNEGVKAEDLHATTYLIVGKNSRFEDFGDNRTGCFWIGS